MPTPQSLLAQMTLEEKVAQISCVYLGKTPRGDFASLTDEQMQRMFSLGMGQVCQPGKRRTPDEAARFINGIQKFLLTRTRLKIPAIMHEEGLHGFICTGVTCFPVPVALAASWNTDLVRQCFDKIGREMRAAGIHQALSPVLDVAREPRWGRFEETFGEDPYLVSRMGVAAVAGFQGGGQTISPRHVIATGKHFCGYAECENGTNVGPYARDTRTLFDVHFRPFEAAIREAHLHAIMPSYNEIAGVPSHGNAWLLQEILRRRMGFKGIVVADYGGVSEMASLHHVAADAAEAAVKGMAAGVDFDLPNMSAYKHLPELVRSGRVSEAALDAVVLRVLEMKAELGLFENPYAQEQVALAEVGNEAGNQLALAMARESIVLLKNDAGLLPLDAGQIKTLAVIGPNAAANPLGAYYGTPKYSVSPVEGLRKLAAGRFEVLHAEGCRITMSLGEVAREMNLEDPGKDHSQAVTSSAALDAKLIAEAVETARRADVVILCLGGNLTTSKESFYGSAMGDRADLALLGGQRALLDAIVALGKPVAVVLVHGGPVGDEHLVASVPAILDAHYLGQEAGTAIAEALLGVLNPSGKLPYSAPRSAGHLPVFYNHTHAARRGYGFTPITPAFAFGFGLSYTSFALANLRLEPATIKIGGTTTVTVDLTNTGPRAGAEVVQLYVCDEVVSLARPVQELKDYQKVRLEPGQTRTVRFALGPEAMSFHDAAGKVLLEPGTFRIDVGTSSRERDQQHVTLNVVG